MLNNYPINAILLLCDYPFPNKVNVERLERKNLELDIFYIAQSTECLFQLGCNRKCDYIWNRSFLRRRHGRQQRYFFAARTSWAQWDNVVWSWRRKWSKSNRSVSVKLSSSLEVVRKYVRRGVIPQKFYKLKLNDNDTF